MQEHPDPRAAEGELRIRVRAAGVNFADVLARIGVYPDAPPPPCVVGYEVAGVVDEVGPGVTGYAPGERVTALTHFGGYSDLIVCSAAQAFHTPDRITDVEAAAIPVNYITAALALYKMAALTAGEMVLVQNAGGGVGIAAVQLARLRRAEVIGTASAGKHDALRSFGVDHAIDYRKLNVEQEVMAITRGRGVDVILDPIGGASFAAGYRMLAPLGRMVMFGVSELVSGERRNLLRLAVTWLKLPSFKPLSLISSNRGVFGLNVGHLWSEQRRIAPIVQSLVDDFASGRLKPVIARTFPLEQAGEAHRYLQSRSNIGKVILTT